MTVYYNEIDHKAAVWLRELIKRGHIADGIVDERSIEDVYPSDLRGFAQCHFFAGIGVWSYALRSAGWADDRPIWTGSCPCQPFSAAGKGTGFADERHLWPAFYHLIKECKPECVIGEQVASKNAEPWIDLVQNDMEAMGYAFGAVPFPSAGIGAPHIRDRLYWLAKGLEYTHGSSKYKGVSRTMQRPIEGRSTASILGNTGNTGLQERERIAGVSGGSAGRSAGQAAERAGVYAGGVDNSIGNGWGALWEWNYSGNVGQQLDTNVKNVRPTGPTNGYWADADWLYCRDGKWRPVEPGTFPLAHGAPARVGRLRGYGNAINAKAAQAFIEALMESI